MAVRTFTLDVALDGHLLVAGGQALYLGVDLATLRRFHEGFEVPYIPATALRGAVRIQLEALLTGNGQEVTTPYALEADEETRTADQLGDPIARLFGLSGKRGERAGSREGALRFSDALPIDPARAAAALGVRPGVELDDWTASAEEQKLFFRQVVDVSRQPLVFRARLDLDESKLEEEGLAPEEIERLRSFLGAAVETTEAIGAGKAKGGGSVRISWREEPEERAAATVSGDPASATRARLLFTLQEPAHFGDGGPHGNHHATRGFIAGATVRGAIAWALLRAGKARPEDDGFKALFLEGPPASFGEALLVQEPGAEPVLRPATARESRSTKETKDVLVSELARGRVNALLEREGRFLRSHDGDDRLDSVPARPVSGLVRRTRTRVSIDRWTGTAAENRLFSIEQLEPWLAGKDQEEPRPVRFVSWVEGLTPAAAALLAKIEGLPVLIGAGRNHGLGLARMDVRFEGEPAGVQPLAQVHELSRRIVQEAAKLAALAGCSPPDPGPRLPLALVALSDYVPGDPSAPEPHPLAEIGMPDVPAPLRRFLNPGLSGGYDQRPGRAPLKDLIPAIGAGSVYVYEVAEDSLADWLDNLLPVLRKGVGQRRESGCGRFELFDPDWHEAAKETRMNVALKPETKRALVARAEELLERKKQKKGFQGATAQLRNMVQVTQQETEIAVLGNFIRYQQGRDASGRFWGLIAEDVLDALKWIEQQSLDEEGKKAAIQSFFGYLVRYYVYLEGTGQTKIDSGQGENQQGQGGARR